MEINGKTLFIVISAVLMNINRIKGEKDKLTC